MTMAKWGTLPDGRGVHAITLRADGAFARVLTFGAILQDFRLPNVEHPLTLGSDDLGAYLGPMRYAGAIVGPIANRIGGARVEIGGKLYFLAQNEGANTLHCGDDGTHALIWTVQDAGDDFVALRCDLSDGFGGLPGNRQLCVRYGLSAHALSIEVTATTDALTLMNPAFHGYWNMEGTHDLAGQRLRIDAATYLPTTGARLPSGRCAPVAGTSFDLTGGREFTLPSDLDHNFCLSDADAPLRPVAWLTGRQGLRMTLSTTAPGVQVYAGRGFSSAAFCGHTGTPYGEHAGVALEPQFWPDAPNHPGFPSILLSPGSNFRQSNLFAFDRADSTETSH